MGILKKALGEKHAKLKVIPLGSVEEALSVTTGFPYIDYNTGTICEDASGDEFLNLGLPMGKIMLFAGNSQGGKTTLAQQIADAMARQLDGDVINLDYERSGNNHELRYCKIKGCSKAEYAERVSVYKHAGMSTEFLKQIIFDIIEIKKKLLKKDMVEWMDTKGNTIYIYPPTFLIVDSIPSMKPQELLSDPDLDNNMVGGKMAASNSAILKTIVNLLETFNITIFGI